jgi:acetate kinase
MGNVLIAFNVGSSSLKASVFELASQGEPLFSLSVDLATGKASTNGNVPPELLTFLPHQFAENIAAAVLAAVQKLGVQIRGCVHRVVHGGPRRTHAALVDSTLLADLERFEPLCPLHQPTALEVIRHVHSLLPCLPQVTVFDTAFHHDQPRLATEYALPLVVRQDGVRAYGFHGISCQQVLRELQAQEPTLAMARVIIAHMGNGASMTAVDHGHSMASTMGFSTLDGLPMGTRPGHVDPGVLLYLLENGWAKSRLTDLLYHQSGLLGLSGISADIRVLLDSDDDNARFAIDFLCYRAAREAASLACTMEGLDAIVFTGGIGEHRPLIRQKICGRLGWLGVQIDADANACDSFCISSEFSRVRVLVIAAGEEREMFLQARELLNNIATSRPAPVAPH